MWFEPLLPLKLAVTFWSALIVTVQVPLPLQAPLQPLNVWALTGVSASVTCWPVEKLALHPTTLPVVQLIPAGVEVTVPEPVPVKLTRSVRFPALPAVKVADTCMLLLSVSVQVELPEQEPPLHPVKVEPEPGVAVSVIEAPDVKLLVHWLGQLMPAGEEVTVPLPITLTVNCGEPPPPPPLSHLHAASDASRASANARRVVIRFSCNFS